jgi:hypothetical protein
MPVATEAMKKLFSLPEYDKLPVYLDLGSGVKASATLTTKENGFVLELLDRAIISLNANIGVIDVSSGNPLMYLPFNYAGMDMKSGDLITCDVSLDIGQELNPVKSEPILLKGDGDNPDILVV